MSEISENVLEVRNLCKYFPIKAGLFSRVVGHVHAVENVSFSVTPGQWWMIAGPNGAGKSTLVEAMARGVPFSGGIL